MAGGVPRSLIVAAVVAAVVAAGALGGAAVLRLRATQSATTTVTSAKPGATGAVGPSGCRVGRQCQVLATTTLGGTAIDLVVDDGGGSGRLRVGGPNSGQVIEATITDMGVTLTTDSLQCLAGGPSACLIKGRHGAGLAGQVVVGRSDAWRALERPYVSDAGYLALANADGDGEPEVLAAQHDCGSAPGSCDDAFVQVFALTGTVLGCTRTYSGVERLPGYPAVRVTASQLTPCRGRPG
ncbi:MAG TPA: hypothetical protein VGX25_35175 [Actinophytocola sp.]|uniref:hypothetical protein n=1 Tax=Actinophytocola sp. TaxID=1872138 RepID=UPI002DDCD666|nr:hypothetical protein [Actinophytocola sp.]HEV2784656.1 hypothetical protein [Actinophytocola sp.]